MKTLWHDFFLDSVEKRYKEVKAKNHRLSVRGFAKMAQLSPGAMSLMLNRSMEWSLSVERAMEVLHLLKVDSDRINHFAVLASPPCLDNSTPLNNLDKHVFLTDPSYMPICLAFGMTPVPSTEHLSQRLKIPVAKVENIIKDLIKRGYLTEGEDGRISKSRSHKLNAGDGPPNQVMRQFHLANIDAIRSSLENDPIEDRDVTSLVFTGKASQIELVKKEIRQFYQRVHAIMNSTDEKDEVFKLVVGFMPLKFSENTPSEVPSIPEGVTQ